MKFLWVLRIIIYVYVLYLSLKLTTLPSTAWNLALQFNSSADSATGTDVILLMQAFSWLGRILIAILLMTGVEISALFVRKYKRPTIVRNPKRTEPQ